MTHTQWFNEQDAYKISLKELPIPCTCGNVQSFSLRDQHLAASNELTWEQYLIRVFSGFLNHLPPCPVCHTREIGVDYTHGSSSFFLNFISKTKDAVDFEVYAGNTEEKEKKTKKILHLQMDVKNPLLRIEENGTLKDITSKRQAKEHLPSFEGLPVSLFLLALSDTSDQNDHLYHFFKQSFSRKRLNGALLFDLVHSVFFQNLIQLGFYDIHPNLLTKPFLQSDEMLNLPPFMLSFVKGWAVTLPMVQTLQSLVEVYEESDIQKGFQLMELEDVSETTALTMMRMSLETPFPSFYELLHYLYMDTKHQQGILYPSEAIHLLGNYLSLAKDRGMPYNLFPSSLKKAYDCLKMNESMVREEWVNQQFYEAVSEEIYQRLTVQTSHYAILAPPNEEALEQDGNTLSYCSSSQFSNIRSKKAKIYFLRKTKHPSKPLLSLEVRGHTLYHIFSEKMRPPSEEEMAFIQSWINTHQLSSPFF